MLQRNPLVLKISYFAFLVFNMAFVVILLLIVEKEVRGSLVVGDYTEGIGKYEKPLKV